MLRSALLLLVTVSCACVLPARGDTVRVLAAGAAKHAIETIAPAFEKATGHSVQASFDTVGAQRDRVLKAAPGATADVVVLSDAALQQLRAAARLSDPPSIPIGQVVVGLAVPAGQPLPDLSDAAALRATLLASPSIAYADPARGATAGTHFQRTLDALGIREAMAGKATVLPFGVDVIAAVSQGRFALGVSQSSEIVQHKEVRYAGPLPAPHGQATGYGAAACTTNPAAMAFIAFLAKPEAANTFRESGFAQAAP